MRKNIIFLVYLLVLSFAFAVRPIHGAVIHVTTTEDNVAGSLRTAITTANTNSVDDTIHLPPGNYILTGSSGEDGNVGGDLDIDTGHSITIIGEGAGTTIIDGNQADRVLHILNGTVSISGVTIQNGLVSHYMVGQNPGDGGGIYNSGTLTLTDCRITQNSSRTGIEYDIGGNGGGIFNINTLTLIDCRITDNEAGFGYYAGDGGGLCNGDLKSTATLTNCTISGNKAGVSYDPEWRSGLGGGISNEGSLILTNSTVYDNTAGAGVVYPGSGGGIYNNNSLNLINCTISNNSAGSIYNNYSDSRGGYGGGICGNATIKNTIVADNEADSSEKGPDCYGTLNSRGFNLIEDTNEYTMDGDLTGNITGIDPMLAPLTDNGGPTQTCALLPGSPAIDAGDSTGISEDQRGYTRPVDIPGIDNTSDGADIGAYECQSLDLCAIAGKITDTDAGFPNVTLTFSHNGGTTVTDDNGNYAHTVSYGWNGTVTPSKEDYSFTPASRDYSNVTSPQTNQDYTASPFSVSVTITSPQNGAVVSGTVTISASASSSQAHSIIQSISEVEFYIDGDPVETDTTEPYQYTWDTTLYPNGTHTLKVKATNAADQVRESEITVTVENLVHISLSRTRLNFGAEPSGVKTGSQSFMINGGAFLNWTVGDSAEWLECTPTSGMGPGNVTVSIDTSQTAPGNYNGTISVESPYADNSPQTITVYLAVYNAGSTSFPFGSFDTPVDGTTVSGSVPVTGWALDDIGVEHIKIYREPVTTEASGLIYIGDALMVEGARPDIEIAYPANPFQYQGGWGYMMLSNFLPNQGNGTFTLHAVATDKEGNIVTLGTTTITCNNADAVKPFGAIDTPTQGGSASGGQYINFGWALTPQPNAIPFDGSTISVLVDGVSLGNPTYNIYREDIASLFPGYANSEGAVGYFSIDTTQYESGVHTISWIVEDDAGNADGIGSRYFTIQNSTQNKNRQSSLASLPSSLLRPIPVDYVNPVGVLKGYLQGARPQYIYPGNNGAIEVEIREAERVVFHFAPNTIHQPLTPLPIGSTFDSKRGIFYWQPGLGFTGNYEFVFIGQTGTGDIYRKHITVTINPRFEN